MMIRQKTIAFLLFATLLAVTFLGATPALAQGPTLPHAFLGTVEIAGEPAPIYTQVEARAENVLTGIPNNPLITDEIGKYGRPGGFDPKLLVQGPEIADGTPIEFYVNGIKAQVAEPNGSWQDSFAFQSGGVTILNLRVQEAAPALPTPTATSTRPPTATAINATAAPNIVPTATRAGALTPTSAVVGTAAATSAAGQPTTAAGGALTATPIPAAVVSTPTSQAGAPQASVTPTAAVLAQAPSPTTLPSPTSSKAAAVQPTSAVAAPSPTPTSSPARTVAAVTPRATGQPILATSLPGAGGAESTSPTGGSPAPCSLPVVGAIVLAGGGAAAYRRRSRKGDQ